MSLNSKLTYLLDTHKINKGEYLQLTNMLEGHDRTIRRDALKELTQRIVFDIEDNAEISPNDKKRLINSIKCVSMKMRDDK